MGLLDLPRELILTIAETLEKGDLNSLLKTQRFLFALLNPLLYKLAI